MSEATSSTAAASPKKAPAKPPEEPVVLFDTKMVWLVAFLGGIAMLANDGFNGYVRKNFIRAEPEIQYDLEPGATTQLDLTVVTGDMARLTCASDKEFEGTHCALHADKKMPFQRPEGEPIDNDLQNVIQPYRTLAHNTLVLVSGLWAQPEVALRVHQEPPKVLPVKRQARFTALCQVTILGKLDEVGVRWEPDQQWYSEKNVAVARAESCHIQK